MKRWLITLIALDACLGLAAHFVKHSISLQTITGATSVLILLFAVFLAVDAWHYRRHTQQAEREARGRRRGR